MAFAKKTWKDRIAEFPTRRRLTKEDNTSELVTVAREEGTLSQEGDAFSAENMNDLENRIDAEFTAVNGKLTTALPSESSIHSLDKKIRIAERQGGLAVQLSIDETKDWYVMLLFDQIGLAYIKNDSNGYVSKRIV